MSTRFPHLFEPIRIGNLLIPNRVVHVPTDISSGNADGSVNERVIAYHEEIARGGCGLIIVGASTPDRSTGRPTVTCLSVDGDEFIPGLHRLAAGMQRWGAKCAVQIQHPGRQAAIPRYGQISCSDMIAETPGSAGREVVYAGSEAHGKSIRAMSVEEVYEMIEKFGEAAWRVQAAGFDCVELHGAHGYLVAQFMSPYTNKRNDRFGGSFKNRMRFPLEIIKRIQHKCSTDFPILIRFSGEEWIEGGRWLDETKEIAKVMEAAGVKALDISAGIFEKVGPTCDPSYYPEGWNTYTADAVKSVVKIPVITSHTLRNPEYCEKIIAEGKTDMVGFSRQLISDPYWAAKAYADRSSEIRLCISCLEGCWAESLWTKREMRCAINPAIGDMRFLHMQPARKSLSLAVVGGGPAGMEAARIAALRGHKVVFFEKENELGGVLRTCCMVPGKQKMKWYLDWVRPQLVKLGVEVRLNTAATPELLRGFDVVACATGAVITKSEIPGAEKLIDFDGVLHCTRSDCEYFPEERSNKRVDVGQKVILWGDHYAAADTAEALAARGREVIIVTENKQFGGSLEPIHKEVLLMRLAGGTTEGLRGDPVKIPVRILTGTTVTEIRDNGEVVLLDDNFQSQTIQADAVLQAHVASDTSLYDNLKAAGLNVAVLGDSRQVRNLRGAVYDGTNFGLTLDDDSFMNPNGVLTSGIPMESGRWV